MKEDWSPFTKRVCTVIAAVPHGRVVTYGQAARLAGNPKGARQVARILHTLSDSQKLPWHRVLSSGGYIRTPYPSNEIQRSELLSEGVVFVSEFKVALDCCQWDAPYNRFFS